MQKDRARPFSRKHRKYWLTVTGGMLSIGVLNLAVGFCAYSPPPPPPKRIELVLPPPSSSPLAEGQLSLSDVPLAVMQAFVASYPRTVPVAARLVSPPGAAGVYELTFGDPAARATFRADGTPVGAP